MTSKVKHNLMQVVLVAFSACSIKYAQAAEKKADTLITVTVDVRQKAQTIDNIGASGCWFSEGIGKYWPAAKKEKIAQLLFSRKLNNDGNPEGIGLSAWRFNLGGGTMEQGDSSGIKDFRKRADCFLKPDGTYDWNKQIGYQYFLKKAHDYGVENLIAFSNTPPVMFTKNGLGYKTEKDYKSNLREDAYNKYGEFLAQVAKHFDKQGLHFNYISPVNEPQWDWFHKYKEGDQEGTPWKNEEVYKVTQALNAALDRNHLTNKILITEAGMLNYLYGGSGGASRQIQSFFDPKSALYMGKFNHVPAIIAGHSYFTESNNTTLVTTRARLSDTARRYGVQYWQSEYSMLGDGFKDGSKEPRSAMDCALFVAKVIHHDLTVGNATAWQFWNSYEPGNAKQDTRYYLIALNPKPDFKDGEFTVTKNLWALGHYSLFLRPGIQRVSASTANSAGTANPNLMVSAFLNKDKKLVVVAINYGTTPVKIKLDIKNSSKSYTNTYTYLTTDDDDANMKALPKQAYKQNIAIPARSISTIVIN